MELIKGHINTAYKIDNIVECDETHYLREYGIMTGVEIQIINKAPLNGPILIEVNHAKLAIRKQEASLISVSE